MLRRKSAATRSLCSSCCATSRNRCRAGPFDTLRGCSASCGCCKAELSGASRETPRDCAISRSRRKADSSSGVLRAAAAGRRPMPFAARRVEPPGNTPGRRTGLERDSSVASDEASSSKLDEDIVTTTPRRVSRCSFWRQLSTAAS